MTQRKEKLAVVEPAYEQQRQSPQVPGCLSLTWTSTSFELAWNPFDRTKYATLQRVVALSENPDYKTSSWSFGKFFTEDCRKIAALSFIESDDKIMISFQRRDGEKERTFAIDRENMWPVSKLIEQLLVKGIAVPAHNDECPYLLEFYENCADEVFFYIPSYIQLEFAEFTCLDELWARVQKFTQEIIRHLDESNTLPIDQAFPIGSAAASTHHRVIEKLEEFSKKLPCYEPIKSDEFPRLFNEDGRLVDSESFTKRCFYGGADTEILSEALPFVFGVYASTSTSKEREEQFKRMEEDYQKIREQVACIKKPQLDHHKKLGAAFRVIMHDIGRTDRGHPAFRHEQKPGLEMLTELLRAYCVYNPAIGYLQGMNDLFVPIMLVYFPRWNDDGMPVDRDGNVITDYQKTLPIIFWCFESMLSRTNHLKLLSNVTGQCQERARVVLKIISKVSPLVAIWMRRNNLQELLWMYSDFVLMFKRTYEEIWPIWLQFNCAPDPEQWPTYFVTALILKAFPSLVNIEQPVSIASVMDVFPKLIQAMPIRDIGVVAVWLYQNYPLEKVDAGPKEEIPDTFDFFETSWTKKKCQ